MHGIHFCLVTNDWGVNPAYIVINDWDRSQPCLTGGVIFKQGGVNDT